ncbi:uncharacterized protein KIAA2012 homolog isoform X3 [Protopterus annectens]|uniref:uncharacterized protein KIAA2012 homolog isoform X3 n=1 Tax=Protopterus annectens TaxID=7888 RepID=UPI001CFBACD1|nr:uncharacterized protein KIAA2012 homolog isoform X3 [Protopterus annectens]
MSTLSLLSRGSGEVVNTDPKRIEVYFEPEDYFNWRIHHNVFYTGDSFGTYNLPNKESCLHEAWNPALAKTYSTKKGPLVLYSEDLALSSWQKETKEFFLQQHGQQKTHPQVELHTLKDLTGAILAYGQKEKNHKTGNPYLHFLNSDQSDKQIRPGYSAKRYLATLSQTWDPDTVDQLKSAGRICDSTELKEDLKKCQAHQKNHNHLSDIPKPYRILPGILPTIHQIYDNNQDLQVISDPAVYSQNAKNSETERLKTQQLNDEYYRRQSTGNERGFLFSQPALYVTPMPESEFVWEEEDVEPITQQDSSVVLHQDAPAHENSQNEKWSRNEMGSVGKASIDLSRLHSEKSRITYYGGTFGGGKKPASWKQERSKHSTKREATILEDSAEEDFHLPRIPLGSFPGKEHFLDPNNKEMEKLKLPPIPEESVRTQQSRRKLPQHPKELVVLPLLVNIPNQQDAGAEGHLDGTQLYGYTLDEETMTNTSTEDDEPIHRPNDLLNQPERNFDQKTSALPKDHYHSDIEAMQPTVEAKQHLMEHNQQSMGANQPSVENNHLSTGVYQYLVEVNEFGLEGKKMGPTQITTEPGEDSDKDDNIPNPTVGPTVSLLPPINGKKGPGNQSSMASFKASNSSMKAATTGIVRGVLPEELRECCKEGSVGSLIMGPDGEIVCVSLRGSNKDPNEILTQMDYIPPEVCTSPTSTISEEEPWTVFHQRLEEVNAMDIENSNLSIHLIHDKEHLSPRQMDKESPVKQLKEVKIVEPEMKSPKGEATETVLVETEMDSRNENISSTDMEQQYQEMNNTGTSTIQVQSAAHDGSLYQNVTDSKSNNQKALLDQKESPGPNLPPPLGTEHLSETLQPNNIVVPANVQSEAAPLSSGTEAGISGRVADPNVSSASSTIVVTERKDKQKQANIKAAKREQPSLKTKDGLGMKHTDKVIMAVEEKKTLQSEPNPQLADHSSATVEPKEHVESNMQDTPAPAMDTSHQPVSQKRQEVPGGKNKKKKQKLSESRSEQSDESSNGTQSTVVSDKKKSKKEEKEKSKTKPEFVVGQPREKRQEVKAPSGPRKESPKVPQKEDKPEPENEVQDEQMFEGVTQSDLEDVILIEVENVSERDSASVVPSESYQLQAADRTISNPSVAFTVTSEPESAKTTEATEDPNKSQRQDRDRQLRDAMRAEQAEKRRLEVERKRIEREELKRRELEKLEREQRMKQEMEDEQRRRLEESRLNKQQLEDESRRKEEEERRRLEREQMERERLRRQQEEYRRKLLEMQLRKQQEEADRAAEVERRQREEEQRLAEERLRLLEMEEGERLEYERRKREEEERRRLEAEQRRLQAEEYNRLAIQEAMRQAGLLARQRALLEQQLQFQRKLLIEADGLDRTQDISRPWVFSYFELLKMLGIPLPSEELVKE